MAHQCRLLSTGPRRAAENMAIDDAILEAVSAHSVPPTLRLYTWSPPAVSIGFFQGLLEEVDVDLCRRSAIDVVRRSTGGGAVFHHREVTYSLVLPETHPLYDADISDSYRRICGGIVAALDILGAEASFAPINDILVKGKKISGNAQTRKLGCLLQHGTVLVDLDLELMFNVLQVSPLKQRGKAIAEARERVTSLAYQGKTKKVSEVEAALALGFSRALDLDFGGTEGELTEAEVVRSAAIAAEKYDKEDWTARR